VSQSNRNLSFFNRVWALIGLTPIDTTQSPKGTSVTTNIYRAKVVSVTRFPANERGANGAILCRVFGKNGETLTNSKLVDLKEHVTHAVLDELTRRGLAKRSVIEISMDGVIAHDPEPRGRYKGDRFFESTDSQTGEITSEPIHRVTGFRWQDTKVLVPTAVMAEETVARAAAQGETTELEAPAGVDELVA
jgi:hypothetical protein